MTDWVSVHAFHQEDQDALLAEGIAPAVAGLRRDDLARGWFFLRYWEGGPHVRVRVAAAPGHAAAVEATLLDRVGRYLRAHPSTEWPDAERYTHLAAGLAKREGLDGADTVLRPRDTVAVVPYRPEHQVYGTGASLACVERHFVESSRLALDQITAGTPQSRRCGLALSLNLLTLAAWEPDLDRVPQTLDPAGGLDWRSFESPDLEAAYLGQRDRLREHARGLWELAGQGGDDGEPLSGWLRSVKRLRTSLDLLAAEGELAVQVPRSPYTWRFDHLRGPQRVVAGILLRCAHLACNRLGVPLADEMYVTYLAARILADLTPVRGK
ncbi:lantibiotic dehydratase C-terminal domain-containing protein [Nonomuraea sp. NPDC046570]|uniref:lantibiotic dehydratase C-terminal domain-containing protein n=1 Tax=Nonomuraea sp. NPDC046570 TaxID=3155255 RepID=UPI0033C7A301